MLPQSLFKQIECSINDVQINDLSTPTYHYKSFLETHLTYSNDMKKTTLKACELYLKDEIGKENAAAKTAWGSSFGERQKLFLEKKKIRFSMILHIDFFQCQRYLIPGCEIKLKFIRSDDTFSLFGAASIAKIKMNKLLLRVRRITVDPSASATIENGLNSSPAIYPICSSKIKAHLLNSGTQSTIIPQVIRGRLPRSFILCFVDAKGYDSVINANPFVFENFGLNYLNLLLNGEPIVPTVFQPDYEENDYLRLYRWYLDNTGFLQNSTNGITFEEFKSNSCFYPFDLSPDLCNSIYLHGIENGTLDIQLSFKAALTKNIMCLVYASYDEVITIDKNRNVVIAP